MTTTHLALVGEQPMPVLLIDRFLRPERTVLICTKRTQLVAERLTRLLGQHCSVAQHVAPYELNQVVKLLDTLPNVAGDEVVVNLTGGTKIMMLAAFAYATQHRHRFVYLESERPPQHLHRFVVGDKGIRQAVEALPVLLTVDDYLRAHLSGYHCDGFSRDDTGALTTGGQFEQAVYQALTPHFDEVLTGVIPAGAGDQIEIDLVIRHDNQVAIAEVKLGRGEEGPKKGIDQLSTAGGREYLGTYTRKLLITAGYVNDRIQALAKEKQVTILRVSGYRSGYPIRPSEAEHLATEIKRSLIG